MRSSASGVARPTVNKRSKKELRIQGRGGLISKEGFQTCNAGRAGAHPSYGGCQAWIVGVAIISFFLNAAESRICGDAQSGHLPQCSATQASGPTRISRKVFALQSPSNPKRATRSGVEEKNGISAEGRAKRVMPDFFFHSATRCATRATFQHQAKGDSFFKEAPHRSCEEAFCQLNIEVSSLQVCRSSTPRQFNLLSAAGLGQPA